MGDEIAVSINVRGKDGVVVDARAVVDRIDLHWIARNTMSPAVAEVCDHAADEIKRLRAAGDAMAMSLNALLVDISSKHAERALDAWQEARRHG